MCETFHMSENPEPFASPIVSKRERPPTKVQSWYLVLGIAGQIGYLIAIPAVLFVMGGAWADKYFGTSPILTLAAIPLALAVSAVSVWRVMREVQKRSSDNSIS